MPIAATSRGRPNARTTRARISNPQAPGGDSRAWTVRRSSRMRIKRRRISNRDSKSPSAAEATGTRSTDRSTIARNPSPQTRRDALHAARAASSQAYSRSSSMIQLARCTAGLKKKTACTTR